MNLLPYSLLLLQTIDILYHWFANHQLKHRSYRQLLMKTNRGEQDRTGLH